MATFSRSQGASRQGRRGVVVEGVDEIVQSFTREAGTVRARAEVVVVDHAAKAAQRMRDRVPVRSGDVQSSITSDETASDGRNLDITSGGVYADAGPDPRANPAAFVARFLEHGTIKMAPQPFVGPSGDETLPEFARAIRDLSKL